MTPDILRNLADVIRQRRAATGNTSYTRKLLDGGPQLCAKKLGEEAVEAVIAVISGSAADVRSEAADVLYHLLVALEVRDVPLDDVLNVLDGRLGESGLVEKAKRGPDGGRPTGT